MLITYWSKSVMHNKTMSKYKLVVAMLDFALPWSLSVQWKTSRTGICVLLYLLLHVTNNDTNISITVPELSSTIMTKYLPIDVSWVHCTTPSAPIAITLLLGILMYITQSWDTTVQAGGINTDLFPPESMATIYLYLHA